MTLNSDPVLARTICVVAKDEPDEVHKCWEAATYGRAVHFEYNKQGTRSLGQHLGRCRQARRGAVRS